MKNTKIILAMAVILALLGGAFLGHQKYQEYRSATYILIDGTEYRRDIPSLDLSGTSMGEWEKLCELTGLQDLNLRDTGISCEQYDTLSAALPGCTISWSVPFQGDFVDCDVRELYLETLTAGDLDILAYLPQLTAVKVNTLSHLSLIDDMKTRYPNLSFSYTLEICGERYPHTADTLDISNPSIPELTEKLPYLPNVTTVNLTGRIPAGEEMIQLIRAYPNITFVFDFEVFGVATNSTADFLDLSDIRFSDTAQIDAIMPLFYNLTKVDMVHCGLSNEEMSALNERYPDTLFVWTVKLRHKEFRTDITELIPVKHDVWINDGDCPNLRYFTELVALDLGHMRIQTCDFVAHMPKLKYLILADTLISDFTPLTGLENLIFLEIFLCPIRDYTPLTTLTALEDLNISYTYADPTVLSRMTWLKRLWFSYSLYPPLTEAQKQALREALPNTQLQLEPCSATGGGWRQGQNYYDMRDMLGMFYIAD